VNVSKFWMGKSEVSWDEFLAFFAETNSQGHASDTREDSAEEFEGVDAITGPTAPGERQIRVGEKVIVLPSP
jgi:sulfatase modifying factor 1